MTTKPNIQKNNRNRSLTLRSDVTWRGRREVASIKVTNPSSNDARDLSYMSVTHSLFFSYSPPSSRSSLKFPLLNVMTSDEPRGSSRCSNCLLWWHPTFAKCICLYIEMQESSLPMEWDLTNTPRVSSFIHTDERTLSWVTVLQNGFEKRKKKERQRASSSRLISQWWMWCSICGRVDRWEGGLVWLVPKWGPTLGTVSYQSTLPCTCIQGGLAQTSRYFCGCGIFHVHDTRQNPILDPSLRREREKEIGGNPSPLAWEKWASLSLLSLLLWVSNPISLAPIWAWGNVDRIPFRSIPFLPFPLRFQGLLEKTFSR